MNPPDSGFVNPSSGTYESGQSVTINVSPNTNYEFDKWTGDWSGSTVPLVLTMDGNKSITANFIVSDSDSDGVVNTIDNCPNTPSGQSVNSSGCALSQIDSDGDGVTDDVDQQPDTRSGVPVDSNGVMLNPVYLDSQ